MKVSLKTVFIADENFKYPACLKYYKEYAQVYAECAVGKEGCMVHRLQKARLPRRWSKKRTQSPGKNEAATASTLVTPTTVTRKARSSPATNLTGAQSRHSELLLPIT